MSQELRQLLIRQIVVRRKVDVDCTIRGLVDNTRSYAGKCCPIIITTPKVLPEPERCMNQKQEYNSCLHIMDDVSNPWGDLKRWTIS